jgi:hypothetical protein
MGKIMKALIILSFFLFTLGCSQEKSVTVQVEALEVLPFLPAKLEEYQVWFELDKDGRLTFFEKDGHLLEVVIEEIMEEILPTGRSFSPEDQNSIDCMREFLKERGIESRLKFVDGSYWIIIETGRFDDYPMLTSICMTINDEDAYPM